MYSIIIPTRNRKAWLIEAVNAVLALTKEIPAEIIVVDDGSKEDLTSSFAQGKLKVVKYIRLPESKGPSNARNTGVLAASGEWLLFMDDDCIPSADWLVNIDKVCKTSKSDFIIGAIEYDEVIGYYPERIIHNPHANWPMGANLIFRKTSFEKAGRFDPAFDPYHNEDTEIAIRAISHGMTYERQPEAKVVHRASYFDGMGIIRSGKHAGVWPILKKKYPKAYLHFHISQIGGLVFFPLEYLYILFYPILLPVVLFRYLLRNVHNPRGSFPMFFLKWPVLFVLRRFHIWKEAVRNGVVAL